MRTHMRTFEQRPMRAHLASFWHTCHRCARTGVRGLEQFSGNLMQTAQETHRHTRSVFHRWGRFSGSQCLPDQRLGAIEKRPLGLALGALGVLRAAANIGRSRSLRFSQHTLHGRAAEAATNSSSLLSESLPAAVACGKPTLFQIARGHTGVIWRAGEFDHFSDFGPIWVMAGQAAVPQNLAQGPGGDDTDHSRERCE